MAPRPTAPVDDWQTVGPSDWQTVGGDSPKQDAFRQPEGSATGRFLKGAWDTSVGGLAHTAKVIADAAGDYYGGRGMSPDSANAVGDMIRAHADQAQKMKDAWNRGEHTEAFGHALATALPVVGPAAAHAAERIGGSAPTFDKYGNVTEQGRAPDVAGGLGEGAGLIVASSPKNIAVPVLKGATAVASKLIPERLSPEGMYQSSLRPSLSKKNLPKIDAQVQTGLREGIPVSSKGLEKTNATIDDINAEIANRLQAKSNQLGPVISPGDVAQRVEDVRPTFEEQVNPEPDLTALDRSRQQFLDKHSTEAPYTKLRPGTEEAEGTLVPDGQGSVKTEKPLTLSEAQAEKQGTYRQLRKKYGELGSADVEAQKSLARGLKEEIVSRVPELAGLNARDSALIELQSQLEKMVAREGNKNILGLVPATMAHNPYGFLATLMMDNPAIKSRIAIALSRTRTLPPVSSAGRLAPAAIPGAVANEQDEIPHYAKGGIAGLDGPEIALVGEEGPEQITPLTAEHSTVPEKAGTIAEQVNQLSSGKRRVVMLPRGTMPLSTFQDKSGNQYLFNPRMISRNDIHAAIQTNNLPKILGAAQGGLGTADKSKLRNPVAVVGQTRYGTTTQDTATDRKHLKSTIRQTAKVTPRNGSVRVVNPQSVIADRLSAPGPVR